MFFYLATKFHRSPALALGEDGWYFLPAPRAGVKEDALLRKLLRLARFELFLHLLLVGEVKRDNGLDQLGGRPVVLRLHVLCDGEADAVQPVLCVQHEVSQHLRVHRDLGKVALVRRDDALEDEDGRLVADELVQLLVQRHVVHAPGKLLGDLLDVGVQELQARVVLPLVPGL